MDIDDVRNIALQDGNPSKYDEGIELMMDYVRTKAAAMGLSCNLH